jgi:hypothetical protein
MMAWLSLSAWALDQSPPSEVGNEPATIPLLEERAYLDRDVPAGDSTPDERRPARDCPGAAMNEPGLTPAQAEQLSETFLTETSIGSIVLFGLIYRLLIK